MTDTNTSHRFLILLDQEKANLRQMASAEKVQLTFVPIGARAGLQIPVKEIHVKTVR